MNTDDVKINGFEIITLDDIPKNDNPYLYDLFNQGMGIGKDVEIMWGTDKLAGYQDMYVIIVNKTSGKRIKIFMDKIEPTN